MAEPTARTPTGVPGLDAMLGGGIPARSIVLVCGGPGAGKTILSLQYTAAALRRGEPCVYVNLGESMQRKHVYARAFGWRLEEAENDGSLAVLDYRFVPRGSAVELVERSSGELSFTVESQIAEAAKRVKARHMIIDPLTSILVHENNSQRKRHTVHTLYEAIQSLGCSALITSEDIPRGDAVYAESFLSDGVIIMSRDLLGFQLVKTIRIEKMRGIGYDEEPRRYQVTGRGLHVFNAEQVKV
jgi:circadian clock protein KaiC